MKYRVEGGVYKDPIKLIGLEPGTFEHFGPMSRKKAYEVWASRAWATIDNHHARFIVIRENDV